ncbi:MAG: insulinase family protein [Elusimicrobia bacterium]|nr:insulinase family protein [Elusimicrobiota bacterium]
MFLRLAWSICVAVSAAAESAPRLTPQKLIQTRLDNGLRVVLAPDASAPVFGIAVTYDVGSRNERPGRTGFAHLFEHMMFQGSKNVGKGEHFIQILNNGGGMNGTTNEDRTNYFETLPKNQLELALFLEADRMRALNVSQANLDNQRNAVQEERRLGIDNQPYGKSYLEIDNLSYDNFAYKHSVIGSMRDLNAATLADVRGFFKTYYAPNNAVLVLAGDIEPDDALARITKRFGSIPAQPKPEAPDLTEEERIGERRTVVRDALARLPKLFISWHIPRGNTPENDAVQMLAQVLDGGKSSRLYQRLVKDKELATELDLSPDMRIGPSLLYASLTPRPGVRPEDLEAALYELLAEVQERGVTKAELAKARRQVRRRVIERRQTALSTAMEIGELAVRFGDAEVFNQRYDRLMEITAAQIQEAARKYLRPESRAVVLTLPKEGKT